LQSAFGSRQAKQKAINLRDAVDGFLLKIQEQLDQLIVENQVNSLIDKVDDQLVQI
jgi:hypothetical protein